MWPVQSEICIHQIISAYSGTESTSFLWTKLWKVVPQQMIVEGICCSGWIYSERNGQVL